MLIITVIIANLLIVCLGQLPEFKVTHTDMTPPIREFAIGESLILLSKGTDIKSVVKTVVELLNTKFGTGWYSMVGLNNGVIGLSTAPNSTLQLQSYDKKIIISRIMSPICKDSNLVSISI